MEEEEGKRKGDGIDREPRENGAYNSTVMY